MWQRGASSWNSARSSCKAPRKRFATTSGWHMLISGAHIERTKKRRTDMLTIQRAILTVAATFVLATPPASAADIVIGLNTVNSGFMKSIAEATDTAVDIAV